MRDLKEKISLIEEEIAAGNAYLHNHKQIVVRKEKRNGKVSLKYVSVLNGKEHKEAIGFYDARAMDYFAYEIIKKRNTILKENLKTLQHVESQYYDCSYEIIMNEFQEKYQILDRKYLQDVLIRALRGKGEGEKVIIHNDNDAFYEKGKKQILSDGSVVRSKSEAIIFEQLKKYGIRVEYECKILVDRSLYRPDFVITRNDGKLIVWEHFGMMDNRDYVEKQIKKISDYFHAGIVLGDNLIITTDEVNGSIDIEEIELLIKNRLIV
mgnify:CR=1 FL=1